MKILSTAGFGKRDTLVEVKISSTFKTLDPLANQVGHFAPLIMATAVDAVPFILSPTKSITPTTGTFDASELLKANF